MPRQARKQSSVGIYHIMLRGINQQQIFEDEEDCEKFLRVLHECKTISNYKLFVYCLMGNHIHLLMKPELEPLELVFRRIGSKYVYWYNNKYQRSGHLFQDRFKSEAVNDEAYLLMVVRYIHQNPVKAGLVESPEHYRWSSYNDYLHSGNFRLTDTEYVLSILDRTDFREFHNSDATDRCLDVTERKLRLTDEQAQIIIKELSNCKTAVEFLALPIIERDKILVGLKRKGLSLRQASRLTGVSKGVIERCFKT